MKDHGYDALVDTLWKDLDERVAREQIAREVSEIAARIEQATVTAYVPIFIRRQALELLRSDPPGESHPAARTVATDDGE